ncbi:hypothetical protein [Micromonospora sp. NPDC049203]|uniref:hypothetical protein n=1 Tax=Micromonospora sp. NPDC049203 TaxID=3364267 RepID=UPI00371B01B9
MRFSRVGARLVTVTTAVLTLGAVTAAPAAADAGSWRAYGNTNPITSSSSTWRCGSTHAIATDMVAQVCAIRSAGGGAVQGAVIVRNNRSSLGPAAASVSLWNVYRENRGSWTCPSSGVAANSWSVCFGATISSLTSLSASGDSLGVGLGSSAFV